MLDSLNQRFARAEVVMGIDQYSTGDSEYGGSEAWNTRAGALVKDWLIDVQTVPSDTQSLRSVSWSPERRAGGSDRAIPPTGDHRLHQDETVLLIGIDIGLTSTGKARKVALLHWLKHG